MEGEGKPGWRGNQEELELPMKAGKGTMNSKVGCFCFL